jgi:hypothetical protein
MDRSKDEIAAITITMCRTLAEAALSKGLLTDKDLENALTTVAHETGLDDKLKRDVWGLLFSLPGDSEPGSKLGQ